MRNGDKQKVIIKATERLFACRTVHTITTNDIAREAKVGKGTIYRYFNDKEDLFFQSATAGFDDLCDYLNHNIPDNISFREQLICACREIRTFFNRRRQFINMIQTEEKRMVWCKENIRKRWQEKRKKLVSIVTALIEKGVKEGVVRSDITPDIFAHILLSMLRTQAKEFSGYPPSIQQPELIVDIFLKGTRQSYEF